MRRVNGRHRSLITVIAAMGGMFAARSIVRFSRRIDFRGRTVLITGGSRGLGLVLAREFAREGCRVAICARDEQELELAALDLRRLGADVLAIQCDVTIPRQVQALIDGVSQYFGQIDILVNNAGTITVGPQESMEISDYEQAMRLHFWAPLYTTLATLPQMRRRGEGRIINISSIGGKIAVPHLLPYSASKFAMTGLSEGLRAELKQEGIYVTTVCPGLMRTGSPRNAKFKGRRHEEYAWFSISDSMPVVSVGARRAARGIIRACRDGSAETYLSLNAALAIKAHGMLPGVVSDLNALINGILPGAGGIGRRRAYGWQSETKTTRSLTRLSQIAAVENNEMVHGQP